MVGNKCSRRSATLFLPITGWWVVSCGPASSGDQPAAGGGLGGPGAALLLPVEPAVQVQTPGP
eukprot:7601497-Alexandrium_andersonii.AAC.1